MFIGHYAVGFAAKRFAPQTSLGVLIAAALMLDLLWPVFVLLGWEHVQIEQGNTAFTPLNFLSYPISHSLVATIGWATLFALTYYLISRYRKGALVIWIGVVSHWVLDFITHRPDMPLYPGGPLLGLGLWNLPVATIVVEGLMYAAGVWIYLRVTRGKDGIGRWGFWAFVIVVVAFYVANILGPPPPSVKPMLIAVIPVVWLLIAWAWWADRHRDARVG
jgi:membrane-bound metal-dependent hydrolase YbcI (DUF457 family)